MDIDFPEYKLRCQLPGHDADVRGICVCGSSTTFATSSRDKTIRVWTVNDPSSPGNGKFECSRILLGHTNFVGPMAYIPPSGNGEFAEGGLVSGGMDALVIVWDLKNGEKVRELKGHKLQVSGVALDGEDILSVSIDCTLRRWRNGESAESWEAHKSAIQTIIRLPSGELVTGSSDSTLKLWKGKTCLHTFVGHTDTVRGLAVMPDLGILSASHDGSLRLWAASGEMLMEMVGHTSIIYSVDSHVSGLVISASEDRSAKIWRDGVCAQSIEHPGCVWDAKFLENGDIVTACSDGVVRVWTARPDSFADSAELESYASVLSLYKISRKRVGGLKLEELPGLEALRIPGNTDGQTKVVREGDNGVAYAWSSGEQKWEKIGEVIDGPDEGMKRAVLDGVQYDHVFDVDIGDGEPIRKLPYNQSDNPYSTAEKWLVKENLPLSYRQQIVDFILQNSGQQDFNLDSSFRDPYTGSGAYIPGQSSNKPAVPSRPTFKQIPKRGMLVFDVAQFDGIMKKISEFSNALLTDQENSVLSLTELEISRLNAIVKVLKDTSHYHTSKFDDADITVILKLLKSWPSSMVFPVIDMLRMIVLHPEGATTLCKIINGESDLLVHLIQKVTTPPASPANLLTSIRAVVNLFRNSCFFSWLRKHRQEILDAFSSCALSSNKNVQLSFSSLILNYTVLLVEMKDEEGQCQVLSAALEVAEDEKAEVDPKFRALVSIGTLMLEGLVKQIAIDFDIASIAAAAKSSKEAKIAEVGADILLLINQS